MAASQELAQAVWTTKDYWYAAGVFVALISAFVAVVSAFKTYRRDLNSLGDSELKTFDQISAAELDFAKFNAKILDREAEFQAANQSNSSAKFSMSIGDECLFDHYSQSVLNAYEIACQRYLDKKLDQVRFEKTYADRLKLVCKNTVYKIHLDKGDFNYAALNEVNTLFNNRERKK
ncbi:hypothetical protein [Raoultella ornithinolytica]|uniref:hypothetical protein n=2 Tax=Raoultella ornithinolytica TaxID=54291 RepID=UPI001C7D6734|nr:hypothetical protein [Raoultella ornithinolytica]